MITEDTTLAELAVEIQRHNLRVHVDLKPSRHFEVRFTDHRGTSVHTTDPVLWRAVERCFALLEVENRNITQWTTTTYPEVIAYAPGTEIPPPPRAAVASELTDGHHAVRFRMITHDGAQIPTLECSCGYRPPHGVDDDDGMALHLAAVAVMSPGDP